MIVIRNLPVIFSMLLVFNGCIEPITESLWSISVDAILQTDGFARDVSIAENTAFVAAGQSGIQIWDISSRSKSSGFTGYEEGGTFLEFNDLLLIGHDVINKLIFVSESNEDVKIFHYDGGDSLIYRNTIMSARTKDFVSFPSASGQFIMYAADNDDGMKWHTYNLDTTNLFGIEFIEWTPIGGTEIYTPGKPMGIDSDGVNFIALAVDQLGVELYSIDGLGAEPVLNGRIDTEGNAEKVTLVSDGVFAACDDAGAVYIPNENFSDGYTTYRFAEDLTVDHIAVRGNIAALTLGSKGIALYDISDPTMPEEKGIFPIGYSYKSQFWGEKLLVCSREGLQILTVEY
jgi:hypothetical protein